MGRFAPTGGDHGALPTTIPIAKDRRLAGSLFAARGAGDAGSERGDPPFLWRAPGCHAARRDIGRKGPLPEARTDRASHIRRAVYGAAIDRAFLGQASDRPEA